MSVDLDEYFEEKVKPKIVNGFKKAKETTVIVFQTFKENPMLAFMGISGVAKTAISIADVVANVKSKKEEDKERCTTYDPYAGANLTTTHELTNGEIIEMTEQMKNGKTKAQALRDMGLLKEEKKR